MRMNIERKAQRVRRRFNRLTKRAPHQSTKECARRRAQMATGTHGY